MFCCKAGQAFLHHLIDLAIGLKSQHYFIRLNKEVKKDLDFWLTFLSDFNEALVHVINKQSCKDKVFVCQMVLLCLKFNILFKAKHIPGVKNNLADALSHLQVQKFRQLAPASMDRSPADIPVHLWPENWSLR